MNAPKFSIVIPARNEERFLPSCLESIQAASQHVSGLVETIVVLNRCTDKTEEIAHQFGARTVREDTRNLARIRNTGAALATAQILVTIDADSRMSPGTLAAIEQALSSGTTVGGGTPIRPDRTSLGIQVTLSLFEFLCLVLNLSGGLFWCWREDFHRLGGFDEKLVSVEDIDFARRLKTYGKTVKRPFSTLRGGYIITSCRKFDEYGDWCILLNPLLVLRLLSGTNRQTTDEFYYDFKR